MSPRIGSLCTGYGGLDLAVMAVLEAELAWCADNDRYAARLLAHHWPKVPNLGDITRLDWTTLEPVDVITAGFPCQDISYAGRGAGIAEGTRSGIWTHIADAVRLLAPELVFVENVAALRRRGLDRVLADLAKEGYDAAWSCLRASDIGAPHRRERIFIAAWPGKPATHPARHRLRHQRTAGLGRVPAAAFPGTAAHPTGADSQGSRPQSTRCGPEPPHPAASNPASPRQLRRPTTLGAPRPGPPDLPQRRGLLSADQPTAVDKGELTGSAAPVDGDVDRDRVWGAYGPAIHRWEHLLGRVAPAPTEPGRDGRPRLAAVFVEWLMGLPAGHVTAVEGIPRTGQLRLLGNGVVPQQAVAALAGLLEMAAGTDTLAGQVGS
ncbi:MAG: DNA cytosine methyltransferase [Mycobacteriales bacterium]